MRRVSADEILPLASYEAVREQFRGRMIVHKRSRRVLLGPEMSVLFEDHDSVLLQVQEMLRTERISDPTAVRFEIDTYNDLVPPDGSLLATLMIEIDDPPTRDARRAELLGLEHCVALHLGDVRIPANFAAEGLTPNRISVVQYLRFDLGETGRQRLLDASTPVRLVVDHPAYAHEVEFSSPMRRSLANDLDPTNADAARSGAPVRG